MFGKAPCTSNDRNAATYPFRCASLMRWVMRCTASVVIFPGLPPNWCGGRISLCSAMYVSSFACSVARILYIVLSNPIGQYDLAMSYLGQPGLWSTTVMDCLQLLWNTLSLLATLYMWYRYSISCSSHFM